MEDFQIRAISKSSYHLEQLLWYVDDSETKSSANLGALSHLHLPPCHPPPCTFLPAASESTLEEQVWASIA